MTISTDTDEDREPPLWLSFFDRVDIDPVAKLRDAFANLTPEQDAILLKAARKMRAMRLAHEAEMRAQGRSCYNGDENRR